MDPNGLVRSDEDSEMPISLSMPSGPCLGDFLGFESSLTMIGTPSSSSSSLDPLDRVNAPSYSHTSDGLPSKLLSEYDVCHDSPPEPQDVYKHILRPDIYAGILDSPQQPPEDFNILEKARCSIDSSLNLSVCETTHDFDAVTRQTMEQHMPNCSPSDRQPTDVGNALIENVLPIPSPSTVHSGLLADGDLQSEVPGIQCDPALSSLPVPFFAHTDEHEPSLLPPMISASNKGTSDDLTRTRHLPERHASLPWSLLLESSHASYNAYNNKTSESGSKLVTDETLTSHTENFAFSHKNTPIDFARDHCQIEASHLFQAPSLDSMSQDLGTEDFNSSPPSSPSMSSAYMLSSSPIPSSSPPPQPSFQTPPTSPPSSPIKDNRVVAEDSSNTVAFSDDPTNTDDETGFSNESNTEQRKLDSNNVEAHRLKSANGIPHPKRPTIAAHRLQQKKLTRPFRSPVLPQAPKLESKPKASATDMRADAVLSTPKEGDIQEHISSLVTLDSKIKYRTARAAAPFKSPLSASNALDGSSLVRLTPTIQALERKLQILKCAVKVREDVQEEVLEGLVKKWTEAGREVAWEVWNLVKDNVSSDGGHGNSQSSKKRTLKGSWGWESPGDAKKPRGEEMERNWGWDVVPISSRSEEEEEDAPKHTLGTMLRQLGVAADTLGWDDEEDSFIDR